jgi:hypothetical protein
MIASWSWQLVLGGWGEDVRNGWEYAYTSVADLVNQINVRA